MSDFLTKIEQSIFRYKSGDLMWISSIDRAGAICGASAAARTFESVGECRDREIDFYEKVSDVISGSLDNPEYPNTHGFGGFRINGDANQVNILKQNRETGKSKNAF